MLRPALLGAALSGSLPLSVADCRWRLRSAAAARNILLNLLLLTLLTMVYYITQRLSWSHVTSAIDVYVIVLGLDQLLRWVGSVLWAWANARKLETLFNAFAEYEKAFGEERFKATVRYVCCFVACLVVSFVFMGVVVVMTEVQRGYSAWLLSAHVVSSIGAYGGFVFWIIIFNGVCRGLTEMFHGVTERLREATERSDVLQLRSIVYQHGRMSELCGTVCGTFGGFIAASMYVLILEVSLSVYFGVRPTEEDQSIPLALRVLRRVLTPSSLILLTLTTNAGHGCQRESSRATHLLQGHLRNELCTNPTPEAAARRAELVELYRSTRRSDCAYEHGRLLHARSAVFRAESQGFSDSHHRRRPV